MANFLSLKPIRMKRPGYLIEPIAELSNLELAWYKAQRGKAAKAQVRAFGKELYPNLKRLQEEIRSGDVVIGGYHYFTVFDPKKRQICAAPFSQRVLHHALMNVCHPYFERQQIFDSYAVHPGRGVPIGNLTSQYFANHYLSPADHYVRETLRIPAYVRYMDDMVLWHHDKAALLEAGHQLQAFICDRLQQELKPFCLNENKQGLPFLGYLLYPDTIRLARRSRQRYIRKIRQYENWLAAGIWSDKQYQNHALPLTAFTQHADAKAFRLKVQASMEST